MSHTRKELERELMALTKDVGGIVKYIEATRRTMMEMVGVIQVLKKKGMVFDDEIAEAVTDTRKASAARLRVQPENTRPDEDSGGER